MTANMPNGDGSDGWCDEHDAEIPAGWEDCRLAVHHAAAGYYPHQYGRSPQ